MDPLSITASTITLIQATGAVATVLGKFANGLKTVDSRVTGLNDELSHLTGFLTAIENTLSGCQRLDLDLSDDRLWHQSEIALVNCQITLNELSLLVNKINRLSSSRGFRWKSRAVVDLNIHHEALASYRDKIHQSNSALQTILHAITVKLSLTNKVSQDQIIKQLDQLKTSIDQALYTSSNPVGGFSYTGDYRTGYKQPIDQKLTRNLRNLAVEAQHFYTAASSTTGTIRSRDSNAYWLLPPDPQLSVMGDFSHIKHTRVEHYLEHSKEYLPPDAEPTTPTNTPPPTKLNPASHEPQERSESVKEMKIVQEEDEDEEEDDAELEQAFLTGLRELAVASIKTMDYTKAIAFLQEAMSHEESYKNWKTEEKNTRDQLKTYLALCHLFQGSWKQAEELVNELRESKGSNDIVVCNLLHTLALGYLSEYSLQEALKVCRMALLGKKRYCKKNEFSSWIEYHETLGLFATIFDVSGDYIRAEVFYREIPADFVYRHPVNASEFLKTRKELLVAVLGDDVPNFDAHRPPNSPIELQGSLGTVKKRTEAPANDGIQSSNWHSKVSKHEKYELDTSKEAVTGILESPCDADDEASPVEDQQSPIRKHFNRFFGKRNILPANTEERYPNTVDHDTSDSSPSAPSPSRLRWLTRRKMFRGKRSKLEKDLSRPKVEIIKRYMDAFPSPITPTDCEPRFSWSSNESLRALGESHGEDEHGSTHIVHDQGRQKEEFDLCLLSQSIPFPYADISADEENSTGPIPSSLSSDKDRSSLSREAYRTRPELQGSLPEAEVSLPKAKTSIHKAKLMLPQAKTSLPKAKISLSKAKVSLPEAKVTLAEANATLPEAKMSLPKLKVPPFKFAQYTIEATSPRCFCQSGVTSRPKLKVPISKFARLKLKDTSLPCSCQRTLGSRHVDQGMIMKPIQPGQEGSERISSSRRNISEAGEGVKKGAFSRKLIPLGPLPNIPVQLGDVISEIATIMASLENIESIKHAENTLSSLLPDLKAMSHDHVFINDVERVIRTLGQKNQVEDRCGTDSGYESALKRNKDENAASRTPADVFRGTNADNSRVENKYPRESESELAFTVVPVRDPKGSDKTDELMAGPKGIKTVPLRLETGFHAVTTDELVEVGKGIKSHCHTSWRPTQPVEALQSNSAGPGSKVIQLWRHQEPHEPRNSIESIEKPTDDPRVDSSEQTLRWQKFGWRRFGNSGDKDHRRPGRGAGMYSS